jgi:hypothetical protein
MKKIKLVLLSILICSIAFSQNFNHIYKSVYSEFNGYEWVTKSSAFPTDMYLVLNGNDISINNNDNSKFKTYGSSTKDEYDTHTCYSWRCVDKDGRDCMFLMKRYKSPVFFVMSFVYSDKRQMFDYIMYNE